MGIASDLYREISEVCKLIDSRFQAHQDLQNQVNSLKSRNYTVEMRHTNSRVVPCVELVPCSRSGGSHVMGVLSVVEGVAKLDLEDMVDLFVKKDYVLTITGEVSGSLNFAESASAVHHYDLIESSQRCAIDLCILRHLREEPSSHIFGLNSLNRLEISLFPHDFSILYSLNGPNIGQPRLLRVSMGPRNTPTISGAASSLRLHLVRVLSNSHVAANVPFSKILHDSIHSRSS